MSPTRRSFLAGCAALLIDRAAPLVPVRAITPEELLLERMNEIYAITRQNMAALMYGSMDTSMGLGRFLEAA